MQYKLIKNRNANNSSTNTFVLFYFIFPFVRLLFCFVLMFLLGFLLLLMFFFFAKISGGTFLSLIRLLRMLNSKINLFLLFDSLLVMGYFSLQSIRLIGSVSYELSDVIKLSHDFKTDMYCKPTDKHQYLSPLIFHPRHCTKNIPCTQKLPVKRVWSNDETCMKRLNGLGKHLLSHISWRSNELLLEFLYYTNMLS